MLNFNYRTFTQFLDKYLCCYNDYLSIDDGFNEAAHHSLLDFLFSLDSNTYTCFMRRWFFDAGFSSDFKPTSEDEFAILKFHKMFISAWLSFIDEGNFEDFDHLLSIILIYQIEYPNIRTVFEYYGSYILDNYMEVNHG